MNLGSPFPRRLLERGCYYICRTCGHHITHSRPRCNPLAYALQPSLNSGRQGLHTSSPRRQDSDVVRGEYGGGHQARQQPRQAQPLGDFYMDILASPMPKSSQATSEATRPIVPTWAQTGDQTKEERAAKVFGTLRGYERHTYDTPDSSWQTVNGVPIPPRPAEPDNCCMSGCVHCVWDDYRDDVEEWATRLRDAQARMEGLGPRRSPKASAGRREVARAAASMDDDGGGSEGLWQTTGSLAGGQDLFEGIPIGIREFMATEKRIRDRKRARKEKDKRLHDLSEGEEFP